MALTLTLFARETARRERLFGERRDAEATRRRDAAASAAACADETAAALGGGPHTSYFVAKAHKARRDKHDAACERVRRRNALMQACAKDARDREVAKIVRESAAQEAAARAAWRERCDVIDAANAEIEMERSPRTPLASTLGARRRASRRRPRPNEARRGRASQPSPRVPLVARESRRRRRRRNSPARVCSESPSFASETIEPTPSPPRSRRSWRSRRRGTASDRRVPPPRSSLGSTRRPPRGRSRGCAGRMTKTTEKGRGRGARGCRGRRRGRGARGSPPRRSSPRFERRGTRDRTSGWCYRRAQ